MTLSTDNKTVIDSNKKPLVELNGNAQIAKVHGEKQLNIEQLAQLNELIKVNYFKIVSNPNIGVL